MPTVLLFCDVTGRIVEAHADECPEWRLSPGTPLSPALGLDDLDMPSMLARFPLGVTHDMAGPAGQPMSLHLLRLPQALAREGGYLVTLGLAARLGILTSPMAAADHVPSAATLDYAVFNAVFNDARDAILLTDEGFCILAANRKAHALYCTQEETLAGTSCRRILQSGDEARILATVRSLKSGASWRGQLTTRGANGQDTPVKLNVRCLSVGGVRLYQFMLRDLRGRMALERDLAKSRLQVADMNTALKHVLRNVEEERQELKDELVQQVREEVLPTVERIALEDSPLVRQAYRSALEEKIADMGETSPEATTLFARLTPRELDICRLIQQGWQGRAIAEELAISFETLQSHRKNIRRKLGLRGKSQFLTSLLQQHPPL